MSKVFIILVFIFLTSCGGLSSGDEPIYMAFDNVDYVSEFPLNIALTGPENVNTNNVGLRGFRILDSLLIASKTGSNGLWEFYSLPDYQNLGKFLKRGEGPLEFMQGPSVGSKVSFAKENDDLISYLYDFQKGRVMRFNISKSISSGELDLSEHDTSLPPHLFEFMMLDQNDYFIKEIGFKDTQQLRSFIQDGERRSVPVLKKLNEAAIREGEDFNILSCISKYSNVHGKIVEMPIGLNNLNIYSLDGSFTKTICLGEKLSNIANIQNQFRWDRKYTFANLCLFDGFFGVVFINEDEKTYQINRRKMPSILLFDYEGTPIAKIQTNSHFTSFDIDFDNQELCTFDVHSDEFLKYDFSEVISKL